MNYKPDETLLMAYLYGELQEEEKIKVEQYLAEHPEAMKELESLAFVRQMLGQVKDKEVIAPPIVLESDRTRYFWNTFYGRAVLGIAASLTLILLVGNWTGLRIDYAGRSLTISFGNTGVPNADVGTPLPPSLSAMEVQEMINTSLIKNNEAVQTGWQETQQKLDESIQKNLAARSDAAFNELARKTSAASEEQIRQFALGLQADNARMIKDYIALNSGDQRKYIEELLVDFARYLEQQHRNDLQVLQARLNSVEQNTDLFKYETEQILTSIMASVDNSNSLVTKN